MRASWARRAALWCALGGCAALGTLPKPAWARCAGYGSPVESGRVSDPRLDEISGLAASRQHPGVFWVHNDSGDGPLLYALDARGQLLGRWQVQGAQARDWEDLAVGPCADGSPRCLYVADFGNNAQRRVDLVIYRVAEPALDASSPDAELRQTSPAEALPIRYPYGPQDIPDAESLMVSPSGVVYVVTKEPKARLLRLPWPLTPGVEAELVEISREGPPTLTGADMTPQGDRLILRNYLRAYEYTLLDPDDLTGLFTQRSLTIRLRVEPQGEAIAYGADGLDMFTLSERVEQPLWRYPCLTPEDMNAPDMSAPDMSAQDMSPLDTRRDEQAPALAQGGAWPCWPGVWLAQCAGGGDHERSAAG